ncbi:DUF58 domain-containing protein [Miltoncostaea marina]|uniref:DUF58 domain-containing protein n=1 Tax=Miltoncostaea marina TaxID=2843215 RepID=UPI001C3D0390|nr:DUF58 domain-containing protein [Miltoncostaea marina]
MTAGPSGRALGLAGAGAAAILASRGFGTGPLATLGAGMLALPLLVTALVWSAARGLRLRRSVEPARARAGEPVVVRLALGGWPVRLGLDRLLETGLDPGIGAAGGRRAPVPLGRGAWRVRGARGDHRLPAARVRVRDPFGLARGERSAGEGTPLLVVPAAPALGGAAGGARAAGGAGRRRAPLAGFGELDRVRDYREGDPLSLVHWGQTAKRGRLQTKELHAPEAAPRAGLVLLDGAAPAGEAFETAVVAAAALCRHLDARRDPFALVHTGAAPVRLPAGRATWPVAEVALARVAPGGERPVAVALAAETGGPDAPAAAAVVTAGAAPGLAAAVARARARGVGVLAVLVGPAAAAADELAAAGAEVVVVHGRDDVARALGAGRGAAGRAA